MIGQDETLGDLRDRRDPTADGALKARLANRYRQSERRIAAMEARFGDWAVVADVLISEGVDGDDLESELAECQSEAKTAAEWMRQNF